MMDFARRVTLAVEAIPDGKVALYGQLAAICGKPCNARQVGQIMGRGASKKAYKVVGAGGRLSGAAAFLIPGLQAELLRAEGIWLRGNGTVDLNEYQWRPTEEEFTALVQLWSEMDI